MNSQITLTSKVELTISCRNLCDMDIMSKSDPMAVVFQKLEKTYLEIGRTETIKNNLNPEFMKVFEIDYHFEERQLFKVEIYDSDCSRRELNAHDFLGRFEFSLGEAVSRRKTEAKLTDCPTKGSKPRMIILLCQESSNCKESLNLQFNGVKLDKKDTFGKSDPLFELYRCNDPIKFTPGDLQFNNYSNFSLVYRSQPIKNTLNPSWPTFNIKLNHLCCGDKDRLIKIVCADWDSDGSQDLIGQCFTSVNHILANQGKADVLELINTKKQSKKKGYKNSGTIVASKVAIQVDHTFIDYISGRTELNFTVAIDFTGSNGKQNDPRSLHYVPKSSYPGMANQYEYAINAVGMIIQDYDSDKMFPALGFGALIPPRSEISHCFPINFCLENPFCAGVQGLLSAYRSAIQAVTLYGPTNFAPSIRHIENYARTYRDGSKYFVLLIITDGIITDFDNTIEAIIDCSYLPMSIIIIGVGNEDFSAMDTLDCDKGRLRFGNKVATRDIVQFVAMKDYVQGPHKAVNQSALSKAVLFELPNQVTSWMKSNGIVPLPANRPMVPYTGLGDATQIPYQSGNGAPPYPVMNNQPVDASPYPPMTNQQANVPHGNGPPPYPMMHN